MLKLRKLARLIPLILCLGIISCGTPAFQEDSHGWILMRSYTNEEKGLTGVEPVDLGEEVELVQEVYPGPIEELMEIAMDSTNLNELPESIGKFRGKSLSWDLYSFETQIEDLGPFTVLVMVAFAEGDSQSYLVGLVTLPESYQENAEKYDSVFYHTLYALSPVD